MKRAVLPLVVALAACHPKTNPEIIPTLPGDGSDHVAKPPPEVKPEGPPDPWANRTDLIKAPAPQAPQAVALPEITRFTLKNGLQVVVVKQDRLPVVQMQMAVRAGRADEPLARLGVAELTANLLPKGTRKHDALAIAKTVDAVGGSITADAGFEATWITCSTLAKDQKVCMDLVPEMLTQPTFTDGEIAKAKDAMMTEVMHRLDDAAALASVHVQNLLWGDGHVRGWVLGPAHIKQLTRDDVVAWHKTWYSPENSVLAVSGAVDAGKLQKDLERAFGGWRKAPVPARAKFIDPPLDHPRIRLVDKPGQTQTQIRVAQYGVRHDDVRFFPSLVWNYTLGGGAFSSRLMTVVRSQGGKTYGASSTFDRNLERGTFLVTTFTRTAETVATLELVLTEIRKMHDGGPTDDEVAAAIANLAGSYAMKIAGADELATALVTADLHGLSQKYVSDYPLLVGGVTRDEAADAAGAILDPDAFVVVLVGDGDKIAPELDAAKVPYERVKYTDAIGPQPQLDTGGKVDPASTATAVKILDAALAAKGGDKVAKLKALHMVATGSLDTQGQHLAVEFDRLLVMPDRMRMDIAINSSVKITFAVTGDHGWGQTPDGVSDLPAAQLPQLELQRWMDPELVLLRHREKGAKVQLLPTATVDGQACDVVALTSPDGQFTVHLYIVQKTKLLLEIRYSDGGNEAVEHFGDYRDVNGVQIAHQRDSSGGGEKSSLTVTKVELDPAIDPKSFDKPAAP